MIESKCAWCNNVYETWPVFLRRGRRHCGAICLGLERAFARRAQRIELPCPVCGKPKKGTAKSLKRHPRHNQCGLAAGAVKRLNKRMQSPKTALNSSCHHRAVHAVLLSPDRQQFKIDNISSFIRNNPHLFDPNDITQKRGYHPSMLKCNAQQGLAHVIRGRNFQWKGWTLLLAATNKVSKLHAAQSS